jgi:hypothetical protein
MDPAFFIGQTSEVWHDLAYCSRVNGDFGSLAPQLIEKIRQIGYLQGFIKTDFMEESAWRLCWYQLPCAA